MDDYLQIPLSDFPDEELRDIEEFRKEVGLKTKGEAVQMLVRLQLNKGLNEMTNAAMVRELLQRLRT